MTATSLQKMGVRSKYIQKKYVRSKYMPFDKSILDKKIPIGTPVIDFFFKKS